MRRKSTNRAFFGGKLAITSLAQLSCAETNFMHKPRRAYSSTYIDLINVKSSKIEPAQRARSKAATEAISATSQGSPISSVNPGLRCSTPFGVSGEAGTWRRRHARPEDLKRTHRAQPAQRPDPRGAYRAHGGTGVPNCSGLMAPSNSREQMVFRPRRKAPASSRPMSSRNRIFVFSGPVN